MGIESTFDTESVTAASNTLDAEGMSAISTATDSSSEVLSRQNPAKWGTERGPSAFSPVYSEYLSLLEREMATMRDQLDSFIAAVKQTAVAVQNNETDVNDALQQISTYLEEQPDAPTRPYGQGSSETSTTNDPTPASESQHTLDPASTHSAANSSGYSTIGLPGSTRK